MKTCDEYVHRILVEDLLFVTTHHDYNGDDQEDNSDAQDANNKADVHLPKHK